MNIDLTLLLNQIEKEIQLSFEKQQAINNEKTKLVEIETELKNFQQRLFGQRDLIIDLIQKIKSNETESLNQTANNNVSDQ